MADNVAITPGSGTTVRTDDVGGVQYQVVKLDLGGDGASIPVVTTLPVSGTVAVSGSVAVTGPLTDTQLRASAVPISGTVTANAGSGPFPVSDNAGSLTVDAPVGTPVFVKLSDGAASLVGQKAMAASIPIVIASDQSAFPVSQSGTWNIGTVTTVTTVSTITNVVHVDDNAGSLTVDAPVGTPAFVRLSDGAAALVGSKVSASSLPVVIASDQAAVAVTPPTLTKGTQGATGFSVQNLKDAGRVNIMWTAEFLATAATEALLTLTESRDGAATTTFTSKVVTNGKRLRITHISINVECTTGTALQRAIARLRFNTAGAVTTASPLQAIAATSTNVATNKAANTALYVPAGVFSAGQVFALSGHDELMRTGTEQGLGQYHGTWHLSTNHAIEIDGDTARTRSYLLAIHLLGPDTFRHADGAGWYDCTLRRTADGWRFVTVNIREIWNAGEPLPHTQRPS